MSQHLMMCQIRNFLVTNVDLALHPLSLLVCVESVLGGSFEVSDEY